jgi:hypothetical protein
VLPLQQPLGHEAASQTHCPVDVLHARPPAQDAHAVPAAPQDVFVSPDKDSQVLPLQQPAHEVPPHPHAPLAHAPPPEHAPQAAPHVPHSLDDCEPYGTQVLPLQQPFEHEVASHTQDPVAVAHSWPVAHAPQAAPAAPHDADDCEAYGSHAPLAVQQPFGQLVALHAHVPLLVSQRTPLPHVVHAAPPAPHWLAVCDE